jgi:tRNA G37 N-methylase Trm5
MFNKKEYEDLMLELSDSGELAQPEGNTKRMVHYYLVTPEDAIRNHFFNMIETYGEEAVWKIIKKFE